jgi:hypothetical protein
MLRSILDKENKFRYEPGQHKLNLFSGVLEEVRNGDKRRTAKYGVKSQGEQTNSIVKIATQSPAEYYRSRGVFNDKHTVDKDLMKKIQEVKAAGSLVDTPHDFILAPFELKPEPQMVAEPKPAAPKAARKAAPKAAPKAEEPKAEAPKAEQPKAEEPKAEERWSREL